MYCFLHTYLSSLWGTGLCYISPSQTVSAHKYLTYLSFLCTDCPYLSLSILWNLLLLNLFSGFWKSLSVDGLKQVKGVILGINLFCLREEQDLTRNCVECSFGLDQSCQQWTEEGIKISLAWGQVCLLVKFCLLVKAMLLLTHTHTHTLTRTHSYCH